ncbi:MAG: IgGFc-binding protein [Myxococcales bacterium]|nr:IgGFc-binding protein [Myxococcales bacterium]
MLWMVLAGCAVDYGVQGVPTSPGLPPTLPPTVPLDGGPDASTRGTAFVVGFMENLLLGVNGEPRFSLSVGADGPTEVVVRLPATGYEAVHTVDVGWTDLPLPDAVLYAQGSDVVGRQGVEVTTDAPVDLLAHHRRLYFSESTLVLPVDELGGRYRVPTLDAAAVGRSGFVVAASEDGTTVELTLSVDSMAAFPAGQPYTVELDAGETYQVLALGDLSGSLVVADAPVGVFGGGVDTFAGCPATSHAWDQILPTRRWGREHLFVPLHGQGGDQVVVVADEDGTEVQVGGTAVVLDAGDAWRGELPETTRILSSRPVGVAQVALGGDCTTSGLGDANLVVLPPLALYRDGADVYPLFDAEELAMPGDDQPLGALQGYAAAVGDGDAAVGASAWMDEGGARLDGHVRGVAFAVRSFDAHTFQLGWDCEGCVDALDP